MHVSKSADYECKSTAENKTPVRGKWEMSGKGTHLHSDETVIDHDLLGQAEEKGS